MFSTSINLIYFVSLFRLRYQQQIDSFYLNAESPQPAVSRRGARNVPYLEGMILSFLCSLFLLTYISGSFLVLELYRGLLLLVDC